MRFSRTELKELVKAWFFISLAFAILFSGGVSAFFDFEMLFFAFVISGLTVGIAFLFHELMHKFVAQGYGFEAEFRADDKMLFIAVFMALVGFIIAAPGAVVIYGRNITKEKNGKISFAGPASNLFLAFLFLIFLILFEVEGFFGLFFVFGFRINSLLALFNLIPVLPFDGRKIFEWNRFVYFTSLIVAIVFFGLVFYF